MWVWASMPPGITYLPAASITVSTLFSMSKPSSDEPGASTAAIVSPSIRTSADAVPVEFTTVPFLMSVFIAAGLRLRDGRVGVGPAVPIELPVVAHLAHHVHVEVADHDLFVGSRPPLADEVAARVDDVAGAIEVDGQLAILVVFAADTVRLQ